MIFLALAMSGVMNVRVTVFTRITSVDSPGFREMSPVADFVLLMPGFPFHAVVLVAALREGERFV